MENVIKIIMLEIYNLFNVFKERNIKILLYFHNHRPRNTTKNYQISSNLHYKDYS